MFTDFAKNDLYIAGESWAGIYVPYLASWLYDFNENPKNNAFWFHIKGFMVGNGCTNYKYDTAPAYVKMGFWHGLYNTDLHMNLKKYNCSIDGAGDIYGDDVNMCKQLFAQF